MTKVKGSAKLVANGEVSLSAELITATRYFVAINDRVKALVLIPVLGAHVKSRATGSLRVYYPNDRAKSGRISLGPFLRAIGLDAKTVERRDYPAVMTDGNVTIMFA